MHIRIESSAPPEAGRSNLLAVSLAAIWLSASVAGLAVVWAYDNGPGEAATAQTQWPDQPSIVRAVNSPTLVFVAHPQCSCTRASLAELAEALTGSAMTRAPLTSLRRNLAIALGNAEDGETRTALDDVPDEARPSLAAPVVGAAMARGRTRRDG